MLGGDDRIDYGCEVIDIRQCLDTENNVVEGAFAGTGGVFGVSDNCNWRQLAFDVAKIWSSATYHAGA